MGEKQEEEKNDREEKFDEHESITNEKRKNINKKPNKYQYGRKRNYD
jgi:hypothetical protein